MRNTYLDLRLMFFCAVINLTVRHVRCLSLLFINEAICQHCKSF